MNSGWFENQNMKKKWIKNEITKIWWGKISLKSLKQLIIIQYLKISLLKKFINLQSSRPKKLQDLLE